MAYQQLHVGKVKLNGLGGILHHHINREKVKTNPDIDLTRSDLNHSIEGLTPDNLVHRVRERIKQLNLKRKLRVDAVGLEEVIVGASCDFMLQLGIEKQEKYFSDALHFFQHRYGKENVMYCQCHLDESNPHIHIGIVPVTNDGRLSARDVFSPKNLEKLQTDFHREVSQHYGLERGEHNSKSYLEINHLKLQKTKQELEERTSDLESLELKEEDIERIDNEVHYVTEGILIKTEDKGKVELPTKSFLKLKKMAEEGAKVVATFNLLQTKVKQLEKEKKVDHSDYMYLDKELRNLKKETSMYTEIPNSWRERVNDSIGYWQSTFQNYCHDINRVTAKVFVATGFDYKKTMTIMDEFIENIGVKNKEKYVSDVISSVIQQFKNGNSPVLKIHRDWKIPEPAETDYRKEEVTGIVATRISQVMDLNLKDVSLRLLAKVEEKELKYKKEMKGIGR
jgi:hypothetical protein